MAKISEQHIVIKVSKLLKDSDQDQILFDTASLAGLDEVVSQLLGDNQLIVEVETE